jgi:antitoxin (DNA-binding transcriptional repressor) of toxin-antitoxin stability system
MITLAISDIPQLSQYLERVQTGEKIGIVQGSKMVAEISAPEQEERKREDEDGSSFWKTMKRLSREGGWVLAERPNGPFPKPNFEGLEDIDILAVLDEVRADRF